MPDPCPKPSPSPPPPRPPLTEATIALESAVAEFKVTLLRDVIFDPERRVRGLQHMAVLVNDWAQEQNFYHPDPTADEDTNRARADQTDRMVFGIEEIAERAAELNEAFDAAVFGRDAQ
jgi:hypothetical protein